MASVEAPRPFYCHHCSHQWMKAQDSLFQCPRCNEGFIEEVSDDFQPNVQFLPSPQSPLNLILEAFTERSRASRGRTRAESFRQANPSRSRSPHISNIVIGTSSRQQNGTDLQILVQRRNNAANRFLSVAIDDIMSLIFSSDHRQGLTQEQLEAIPLASITNEQVQNELQCAVCFENFQLNENEIRKLVCNHFFHEKCIFPWLRNNPSCPVCRTSLAPPESDSDDNTSEPFFRIRRSRSNQQRGMPPDNEIPEPSTSAGRPTLQTRRRLIRNRVANPFYSSPNRLLRSRGTNENETTDTEPQNGTTSRRIVRPARPTRPILNSPIAMRTRNRSRDNAPPANFSAFRPRSRVIRTIESRRIRPTNEPETASRQNRQEARSNNTNPAPNEPERLEESVMERLMRNRRILRDDMDSSDDDSIPMNYSDSDSDNSVVVLSDPEMANEI